jgi:DNA processing protein
MSPLASWQIAPGAPAYPRGLLDLDRNQQPHLHGVGRRDALTGLDLGCAVTIVGARNASSYGLRVAESLARDLARARVTVVSGLARGIDSAAHSGALSGGGPTIAVLAGGPDIPYPPRNRELHRGVAAAGAVISEHPPGSGAQRHHFAQRNRIMAALGGVVVIVEAAQPSGSLITADVALRLGRTVGAVPGQLGVRVAEGTNDLLSEGAHLIRDARDVLDLLFGVGAAPPGAGRAAPAAAPPGAGRAAPAAAPAPRPGPALDPQLRAVLELVRGGAATVDRLAGEAALEPRRAAAALARLELLGYVRADALGAYAVTRLRAPE